MLPATATLPAALAGPKVAGSSISPFGMVALGSLGLQAAGTFLKGSQTKKQIHWQREQLQKGIQYRVADAKAAGIHPLYALGANIQSPSPIQVDGGLPDRLSQMGQGLGQFSERFQTAPERLMARANLNLLSAQTEESLARGQYFRSQALQGNSASAPQAQIDTLGNVIPGQVQAKPSEVISARPDDLATEAGGPQPGKKETMFGAGVPFGGLSERFAESLESTPIWMLPGLVMQQANKYGDKRWDYVKDFWDLALTGSAPKTDWTKEPMGMYGPPRPSDLDKAIQYARDLAREGAAKGRRYYGRAKKSFDNRVK